MAGTHQIWKLDLEKEAVGVWAGTGRENIIDGDARTACFAQPSGLATDGKHLFVADSEGSVVREIALTGDPQGPHDRRRPRPPRRPEPLLVRRRRRPSAPRPPPARLGVAFHDGKLFIADTYNNKIKVVRPQDPRGQGTGRLSQGRGRDDRRARPGSTSRAG